MMNTALLLAALLGVALSEVENLNEFADCRGRPVSLYIKRVNVEGADTYSLPDTFVQMSIGEETQTTEVVYNTNPVHYNEWFSFKKAKSNILQLEILDKDTATANDHMGHCAIKLNVPLAERSCKFAHGDLSLYFICAKVPCVSK